VSRNNIRYRNFRQEGYPMKEAKHSLKVTTLFLYAVFIILTPAILYAGDRLNPGEMLRVEEHLTSDNHQYRLVMQNDGNLVLYDARRHPLWSSNTQGQRVEKCIMQRDGNLVLYLHNGQPAWSSNTQGKPGSYLLVQNDGNMVIYRPQGVWASETAR
jgi:hypothetical protein